MAPSFHLVVVLPCVYIKPATFWIVDKKKALVQYLKKICKGHLNLIFLQKKLSYLRTAETLRLAGHFQLGFEIHSRAINFLCQQTSLPTGPTHSINSGS